jgi:ubiquinone/menaquinone biosynthesis C-methylase UbiE
LGPLSERLLELAEVGPGDRVLDIATGIGEPAVTTARRVGPEGRVLATDIAPGMLEIGRERAAELGLDNVEFWEADAEALELPASGSTRSCAATDSSSSSIRARRSSASVPRSSRMAGSPPPSGHDRSRRRS